MTVTFLVYSATAVIFFRDSDPYHFGDLSMAMYTYFEMSTLDVRISQLLLDIHGVSNNFKFVVLFLKCRTGGMC